MTNPPRVILISRRMVRKNKVIDWVSERHLSLLLEDGLLPVIVPVVPETLDRLAIYAGGMAGLLLVEGGDIHPAYYNGRASRRGLEELDPVKDRIEFWFCRRATGAGVPILGICRGMQLLNVIRGGTLHRDVLTEKGVGLKHIEDEGRYDTYRHTVAVLPDTPLRRWYGRRRLRVNSYHHQGVKRLAPVFRPMAFSPDGLVEAFYDPRHRFQVGLQFHPERMLEDYAGNRRVFDDFTAAVKSYDRARPH